MPRAIPAHLFAVTALIALCTSTVQAYDPIQWAPSLAEAQKLAREQNRLVLVHFWSESCGPCMRLDRTVFNRREFANALHRNYIPVKVNTKERYEVAERFRITNIPTDVILAPDGREIHRTISPADPNRYIAMLDEVAAHHHVAMTPPPPSNMPLSNTTTIVNEHTGKMPGNGSQQHPAAGQVQQKAFENPFARQAPTARAEAHSRYSQQAGQVPPQHSGPAPGPAGQPHMNQPPLPQRPLTRPPMYQPEDAQFKLPSNAPIAEDPPAEQQVESESHVAPPQVTQRPRSIYSNPAADAMPSAQALDVSSGSPRTQVLDPNQSAPPRSQPPQRMVQTAAAHETARPERTSNPDPVGPQQSLAPQRPRTQTQAEFYSQEPAFRDHDPRTALPMDRHAMAAQPQLPPGQRSTTPPTSLAPQGGALTHQGAQPNWERGAPNGFSPRGAAAGQQDNFAPHGREAVPQNSATPPAPAIATGLPAHRQLSGPPSVLTPPPPGLEGYCPVSLVENDQWAQGDPRWSAIFEQRTYYFAGPEQRERFLRDPVRFCPAMSGYDVVRYRDQGVLVPGKREHGVFAKDDRGETHGYYLFADEASLERFCRANQAAIPPARTLR